MKSKTVCRLAGLFLLPVLMVGGCALSPQRINLDPNIAEANHPVTLDGPVAVTVYDERISPVIGNRGGVYGDSNKITVTDDLPQAVGRAVAKVLQSMGMQTVDSASAPQFQVYVDNITYKVPAGGYVTQVDLKASVRVVVQAFGTSYQGQYSASASHKVLKAPSDEKNVEMVNGIVDSVLVRVFEDPGLMRFLARL